MHQFLFGAVVCINSTASMFIYSCFLIHIYFTLLQGIVHVSVRHESNILYHNTAACCLSYSLYSIYEHCIIIYQDSLSSLSLFSFLVSIVLCCVWPLPLTCPPCRSSTTIHIAFAPFTIYEVCSLSASSRRRSCSTRILFASKSSHSCSPWVD